MGTNKEKPSFESCLGIIDNLLNRRRYKWQIRAIVWMDFEDIKQIIKLHLFKKWHLYDPNQPLEPWVAKVISSQMINLSRNVYYSNARPCLRCPSNQGNNLCELTKSGEQDSSCSIFRRWEKSKKASFDIELALPLVNHEQEVHNMPSSDVNFDKGIEKFHIEMKKVLKPHEYRVYECLFILHLSEELTAERLGFRSSEPGRIAGYARIKQIEKIILQKANKLKDEIDLF